MGGGKYRAGGCKIRKNSHKLFILWALFKLNAALLFFITPRSVCYSLLGFNLRFKQSLLPDLHNIFNLVPISIKSDKNSHSLIPKN